MTFLAFLWEYKFYIASFIIGGMLFGGGAWKIQGVRLDNAKATLTVCESANKENSITIEQLKVEAKSLNKSCEARIKSKDTVIKRLKDIDALTSENISTGEDTANETVDNHNSDAIVSELNVMFKQSDSKD